MRNCSALLIVPQTREMRCWHRHSINVTRSAMAETHGGVTCVQPSLPLTWPMMHAQPGWLSSPCCLHDAREQHKASSTVSAAQGKDRTHNHWISLLLILLKCLHTMFVCQTFHPSSFCVCVCVCELSRAAQGNKQQISVKSDNKAVSYCKHVKMSEAWMHCDSG